MHRYSGVNHDIEVWQVHKGGANGYLIGEDGEYSRSLFADKMTSLHKQIEIIVRDKLANQLYLDISVNECPYDYIYRNALKMTVSLNWFTDEELEEVQAAGQYIDLEYHDRRRVFELIPVYTPHGPIGVWHYIEEFFARETPYDRMSGAHYEEFSVPSPISDPDMLENLRDALLDGELSVCGVHKYIDYL